MSSGSTGAGESEGAKTGMGIRFINGYALLIGVGRCAYSRWSLPVTVRDVVALRKVLVDPGHCAYPDDERHIRVLTDDQATGENILAALGELAQVAAEDPEATVTVCYTGHGWLQDDRYYLIPHDVVPHELSKTAVPAEAFIEGLRRIRSQRLVVMLDTCHAEGMAEAKFADVQSLPRGFSAEAPPESLIAELGQGEGRAVFQSCRGKQKSWILKDESLSIFSHHLIEGLKGKAGGQEDKHVMISSLMNYVSRKVEETARGMELEQTPFFKIEAVDFPVALLRGGAGLGERPPETKASPQEAPPPAAVHSGRDSFNAGRDVFRADEIGSISTGAGGGRRGSGVT